MGNRTLRTRSLMGAAQAGPLDMIPPKRLSPREEKLRKLDSNTDGRRESGCQATPPF